MNVSVTPDTDWKLAVENAVNSDVAVYGTFCDSLAFVGQGSPDYEFINTMLEWLNDSDYRPVWYFDLSAVDISASGNVVPENALNLLYSSSPNYVNHYHYSLQRVPVTIVLPENTVKIERKAFANTNLVNFIIPASVEEIGDSCFYNTNFNDSDIVFGSSGVSSIKEIGVGAFAYTKNVGDVILPDGLIRVNNSAFSYSDAKKVVFPNTVKSLGKALDNMSRLKEVVFPDGLHELANGMCEYDRSLESVTLGSDLTEIGQYAFSHCENLKNIELPENMWSICTGAFSYTGLQKIDLPENLHMIMPHAFLETEIEEFDIPQTIDRMERGALKTNNRRLKRIRLHTIMPPTAYLQPAVYTYALIDKYTPGDSWSDYATENIEIYVPQGSIENYKSIPEWACYNNYIEYDESGVEGVTVDPVRSSENSYDVLGRQVQTPATGTIYIHDGQKFIAH